MKSKYAVVGIRKGAIGLGSYADPESLQHAETIEEVELGINKLVTLGHWYSVIAIDQNGDRPFKELEFHLGNWWK